MAKRSAQQLRRTAAQMHALAAVRNEIGTPESAQRTRLFAGIHPALSRVRFCSFG